MSSKSKPEEDIVASLQAFKTLLEKEKEVCSKVRAEQPEVLLMTYENVAEYIAQQQFSLNSASKFLTRMIDSRSNEQGLRKQQSRSSIINALDSSLPQMQCPTLNQPSSSILPGREVAARLEGPEGESWILALVVRANSNKWIVEDIMGDAEQSGERHLLHENALIPLPVWQPCLDHADNFYPPGARVLALYPQTTCFYPAQVRKVPTVSESHYVLRFDEDEYEDGRVRVQKVPVKYVVVPPSLA